MLAVFGSLGDRLRRFEGALLGINLSILVVTDGAFADKAVLAVLSVLTLAALYGFNDFWDSEADLHNPRKQRWLIDLYASYRRSAASVLILLHAVCVWLAFVAGGWPLAFTMVALFGVNVAYSLALKGMPLVDVVWCGLWGALYAAIVGIRGEILAVVGIMTAVCHVYQTLVDSSVDARNGIHTIAARAAQSVPFVLAALCAALALLLAWPLGLPKSIAWSAFAPIVPYYAIASRLAGWLLAKAYFGLLWLFILSWVDVAL